MLIKYLADCVYSSTAATGALIAVLVVFLWPNKSRVNCTQPWKVKQMSLSGHDMLFCRIFSSNNKERIIVCILKIFL